MRPYAGDSNLIENLLLTRVRVHVYTYASPYTSWHSDTVRKVGNKEELVAGSEKRHRRAENFDIFNDIFWNFDTSKTDAVDDSKVEIQETRCGY